jgi:hypothetical protein
MAGEITDSKGVTDKLVRFGLDSIEGRLSFFGDGRYPHGAEKYTCGIAIAISQGGRTGLSLRGCFRTVAHGVSIA